MKRGQVSLVVLLLAVAIAAFVAGRELKPAPSGPSAALQASPAFEPAATSAGLSPAGFSGFGETPGLEGRTVLSGRVVSLAPTGIVIETPAGLRQTVQLAGEGSLKRIEPAGTDALLPGTTVVVRRDDSGVAAGILVVGQP